MKISVWQKDMDVIGGYARKIKVPTPMFDASSAIYEKALKSGHGAEDTAAVCAVLEKMAGVKRGARRKKRLTLRLCPPSSVSRRVNLLPGIDVFNLQGQRKTWMAGTTRP